jgi:hypothetical protein
MKRSRFLLETLAVGFLAAVVGLRADASSVMKMNVRDLASRSDLVFAGTVISVDEIALADDSMAYTFVTFGDLDILVGSFDQSFITLRFDGGSVGDNGRIDVSGMPRFADGERVVLFVNAANGACPCPVTGWGQGLLRFAERTASSQVDDPALADESGALVHGIRRGEFVKSPAPAGASHSVEIVSSGRVIGDESSSIEDGGEGESDGPEAHGTQSAVPADLKDKALTLSQLRGAVLEMRARAGAQASTRIVRSADPADLPATDETIPVAAPAPRMGDGR